MSYEEKHCEGKVSMASYNDKTGISTVAVKTVDFTQKELSEMIDFGSADVYFTIRWRKKS